MTTRTLTLAASSAQPYFPLRWLGPAQGPPPQLRIEQVKPGLYAILNTGANTLAARVTGEGVILVDDMFDRNCDRITAGSRSTAD